MYTADMDLFSNKDTPNSDIFPPHNKPEEGNVTYFGFQRNPKFGRDSTFDEDILSLIKKWKGTKMEVFVRHMIDSLIIFNHNREQLDNINLKEYAHTGDRFGDTEVWKAIQLQLHS